jgi:hypothetical protein
MSGPAHIFAVAFFNQQAQHLPVRTERRGSEWPGGQYECCRGLRPARVPPAVGWLTEGMGAKRHKR